MVSKFKVGDRVTWTDKNRIKRWGRVESISTIDNLSYVNEENTSNPAVSIFTWELEKSDFIPGDLISWKVDDCIKSGTVKRKDEVGWYVCVDEKDSEWIVRPSDMTGFVIPLGEIPSYPSPTGASDPEHPTADTGAKREKLGTIPYDLVPFQEMTDAYVRVAEFGAKKYESWNWSKGLPRVQILCSLLRHTFAYLRGEERDSDSKLLHTDHILWNAVTLAHNVHWGLTDGRRVEPHRDYKIPLDTGVESV